MTSPLIARLGALPPRQFHLLGAAIMLAVAALLWSALLRAPMAQWRQAQTERARLAALPNDARPLDRRYVELNAHVRALEAGLGMSADAGSADRRQLELIGMVNRSAQAHGVRVLGAAPTPARVVASFNEMAFEVSAAGSYQQVADWLADLERAAPNLAVAQLELSHNPVSETRDIKLRIAAYFPQEATR
ncbi:GspMb/PilO family protein [Duganella aceris]|uniref:Type II secretion system protein M n=1 Tax=Duganella aceris TaxID=2703883 RepID=A0ABX0FL24_9BURK|nr:GspMb/PilO family protein [Duganella aceris]NGZ85243.1 type II secretion system protein M [Duganella aceris]